VVFEEPVVEQEPAVITLTTQSTTTTYEELKQKMLENNDLL